MIRTPVFWYRPPGRLAKLLTPLGMIYAHQTARRLNNTEPHKLDIPVICIGNLHVGGTGKTPTVIAIVEHLKALGMTPHIITRGYGGSVIGPKIVSERDDLAEQVGDEPLLLSNFATTWVARDRAKGGKAAQKAGATVIVMDDGFQNPSLQKDISIVVTGAGRGFGNGLVLPAGPLREPIATGLERADFVLSIGSDTDQAKFSEDWESMVTVPRLTGELRPLETGMDWSGTRVLAFAGIGNPSKFFATLKGLGAEIVRAEALVDHQPLTEKLMKRLLAEAANHKAQLVTTEKDSTRLPPNYRQSVLTLPVRLEISNLTEFDKLLESVVAS